MALYLRQLRATVIATFLPELRSPTAVDAAGLVDRILAELIVEDEFAGALSQEFGAEFAALLAARGTGGGGATETDTGSIVPDRFSELRRQAAEVVADLATSDVAADRQRCRRLVDVEHRFLERVDELRRGVLDERPEADAGTSSTECSLSREQLTEYLRHKLPSSPELVVTSVEVIPGGRSKETILVALTGTTELPDDVVIRRDRPVGILQTRAADEFAILEALYGRGDVPVPRPFFADELDGGTLLVMARVEGHKAGEYFPDLAAPTEHRHTLGQQLAAALAHVHRVPLETLAGSSLDLDAGRDRGDGCRGGRGDVRPYRGAERTAHRGRPTGAPVAPRPRRPTWCPPVRSTSSRATSACTTCSSTETA